MLNSQLSFRSATSSHSSQSSKISVIHIPTAEQQYRIATALLDEENYSKAEAHYKSLYSELEYGVIKRSDHAYMTLISKINFDRGKIAIRQLNYETARLYFTSAKKQGHPDAEPRLKEFHNKPSSLLPVLEKNTGSVPNDNNDEYLSLYPSPKLPPETTVPPLYPSTKTISSGNDQTLKHSHETNPDIS